MLLKSLQDLLPDELVNAELSDMDAFCLDSALLDAAAPAQQGPASNFRPGNACFSTPLPVASHQKALCALY